MTATAMPSSTVSLLRLCKYRLSPPPRQLRSPDGTPQPQPHTVMRCTCSSLAVASPLLVGAVLIGLAGAGPLFTREVLEAIDEGCQHQAPIVMAMSNPTAKMECTAEEAQRHTSGRAVYASGSPQEDVMWEGKRIASTQANNMCAAILLLCLSMPVHSSVAHACGPALFCVAKSMRCRQRDA